MKHTFFLIFSLLSSLCFGNSVEKPLVITTIAPYTFLVKELAGEGVEVHTLVPKSANAHLYEPSPKEIAPLKAARLWVRMGEGFEERLHLLLKQHNPQMHTLETWQGLPLIAHAGHAHHASACTTWDRHLWLSVRMLQQIVPKMAEALIALLPGQRSAIKAKESALLERMKTFDVHLSSLLMSKKGTTLLTAHPSFAYFCRDYALEQLSIESEGKDPLPQQLETIFKQARKHPLGLIVVQPQFPKLGAKRFADKLNLSIYTIDPYDVDIFTTLETLARAIAQKRSND